MKTAHYTSPLRGLGEAVTPPEPKMSKSGYKFGKMTMNMGKEYWIWWASDIECLYRRLIWVHTSNTCDCLDVKAMLINSTSRPHHQQSGRSIRSLWVFLGDMRGDAWISRLWICNIKGTPPRNSTLIWSKNIRQAVRSVQCCLLELSWAWASSNFRQHDFPHRLLSFSIPLFIVLWRSPSLLPFLTPSSLSDHISEIVFPSFPVSLYHGAKGSTKWMRRKRWRISLSDAK